jgi:hypothetical protein
MIAGLLALTSAAVFFGAAIYVLAVEHVAREALDDRAALMEWQPAYKRGAIMQATISLLSTALGALAWWQTANIGFGIGAILALLPWPWTLLVIKPTTSYWQRRPKLLELKAGVFTLRGVICTQYEWPWAALRRSHFSLG